MGSQEDLTKVTGSEAYAAALDAQIRSDQARDEERLHLEQWVQDASKAHQELRGELLIEIKDEYFRGYEGGYYAIFPDEQQDANNREGVGFGYTMTRGMRIQLLSKSNAQTNKFKARDLVTPEDYETANNIVARKLREIEQNRRQDERNSRGSANLHPWKR